MSWTEFDEGDLVKWSRVRNAWNEMHRDENEITDEPPPVEWFAKSQAAMADQGYKVH